MSTYVSEEKFLFNEKDSVNVNSKVALRAVIGTSRSVSKEALTLGEILSIEDSQRHFPNSFGERSFSETESGSARMIYSGPTSVSGSLSVRSDGTISSASSFAFPILQSEWDSSPVRMVEAVKTNSFGERSFSEVESGSARIIYSGPASVSGNLSVRSDRTISSRSSFAPPILQSEWNSSPEDEKTQLRKEKGWRRCALLLCCRF